MPPLSHVGPSRSHSSVTGVKVIVKSSFGPLSGGSLKTLWSMPRLVIEIVGFIISGPMWTRTSPFGPLMSWAPAGAPWSQAIAKHTGSRRFSTAEAYPWSFFRRGSLTGTAPSRRASRFRERPLPPTPTRRRIEWGGAAAPCLLDDSDRQQADGVPRARTRGAAADLGATAAQEHERGDAVVRARQAVGLARGGA